MSLSGLMGALMSSLLARLEGRTEEAVRLMDTADTMRDPEILGYFARHSSRLRLADSAVRALKQAGFVCASQTLTSDAWLSAVRKHPEFGTLSGDAEIRVERVRLSSEGNRARPNS